VGNLCCPILEEAFDGVFGGCTVFCAMHSRKPTAFRVFSLFFQIFIVHCTENCANCTEKCATDRRLNRTTKHWYRRRGWRRGGSRTAPTTQQVFHDGAKPGVPISHGERLSVSTCTHAERRIRSGPASLSTLWRVQRIHLLARLEQGSVKLRPKARLPVPSTARGSGARG